MRRAERGRTIGEAMPASAACTAWTVEFDRSWGDGIRLWCVGAPLDAPYRYCSNYRPSSRHGTATDSGMSHLGFRCVKDPVDRK